MSENREIQITLSFDQLTELLQSAHEVEKYLYDNCGTTADWPLRIISDNPETTEEVRSRLQRLREALAPIRTPQP